MFLFLIQVDLEHPDFIRFPHCASLSGFSVAVNPGDILYIPSYWWRHTEAMSKVTISVTFSYTVSGSSGVWS